MEADSRVQAHLESGEVAAYLDGALEPSDLSRVEAHLATCDRCRTEVTEVARLLYERPRRQAWHVPIGVAAAAAVVLLLVWPRPGERPALSPGYREPVVTTTVAPVVIAPRGAIVAAAPRLVWTRVPGAYRYRLAVFDDTGTVLWETQTSDTSALVPGSIRLHQGASYYWKVEAQTGWDRWVTSDLVAFSLRPPRP
jgi:anti-sigma factor RsiW